MAPSLVKPLTRTLREAIAASMPQRCLLCGGASGGAPVCEACGDELPRLPPTRCPQCALPSPGGHCGRCLRRVPAFDASHALLAYAFPADRLVQALKYRARLGLAAYFSRLAINAWPPPALDCMVAVPMHARALRERGFNQAVELARPLARAWALPLLPHALRRIGDGPPQASLAGRARRRNVRDAFVCDEDMTGRAVLVIDDVMTTGATLEAIARCLRRAGATRVENLVIARTLAPD
ncbi:ComF family protein [Pseudazoarcus pumilus]|uniref:Phosphoribosyltransferase n=1 Tax=Pseudazoarcus pumilus TaxID=2067960 RepID=A0A2I6S4R7_9RHOO|nr:ComF family protein [Pseudazoarcus pumilus]AUN94227.1 phosphoribosyltransferase [Pseudazoarcus pumilus]